MCFEFFLVCVGVDCLRVISRVKDLEQWASAFSASCGFRNLCIKSGYEKSRVTSTRHKARCMVCMKDVDISSMGEFALTSHLKGKKNIKQWHPRKGHYQASQICFGISSQRPATKSDDAKVVSKSASSESGKHTKLNSRKSFTASSSVMEKCHLWWDVEGRNFMGIESNYVSLRL